MRYTEKTLRKCLEKIDPETYRMNAELAKLSLPKVLDIMFVVGFKRTLVSRGRFFENFLSEEEINILSRAYNDLYTAQGYFIFDKE